MTVSSANSARIPMWRSTPPAIFPSFLGLFGLGLGWRRVAEVYDFPSFLGEAILLLTIALYMLGALSYGAKALARPPVVAEDLGSVPGRAGVGAITIGLLLAAIAMEPYSTVIATCFLGLGLIGHAVLAVMVSRILWALPTEQRQVMPTWHLAFVAFIVGPISAVPLGFLSLSYAILICTVIVSALIYATSARHFLQTPPPLRPLLVIHLAPVCLFATVSGALELSNLALGFAVLASVILLGLLIKTRFLIEAGFSPLWGAFTFPLAAYAVGMLGQTQHHILFDILGVSALFCASVIIPLIVTRVMRLWLSGKLTIATKAAVA